MRDVRNREKTNNYCVYEKVFLEFEFIPKDFVAYLNAHQTKRVCFLSFHLNRYLLFFAEFDFYRIRAALVVCYATECFYI